MTQATVGVEAPEYASEARISDGLGLAFCITPAGSRTFKQLQDRLQLRRRPPLWGLAGGPFPGNSSTGSQGRLVQLRPTRWTDANIRNG